MWEEHFVSLFEHLAEVGSQTAVVFLVHGFQLRVETTNHHVLEAVCLHDCPAFDGIRRNVLLIDCFVRAGVGIGGVRTYGSHQLVVFIGDGILRSLVGDGVNLVVDGLTLICVGCLAIHFVEIANLVEQRLFGSVVLRTKRSRTLEEDVFQIVSQSCCLMWVVLATRSHGNVRLDSWTVLVHAQIDLKAVAERVDASFERVALIAFVLIVLLGTDSQRHHKKS